jgi:hypothetical protein
MNNPSQNERSIEPAPILHIKRVKKCIMKDLTPLLILLPVGLVLYFLHNAFCVFHKPVPFGKMHEEAITLVHKAHDVLMKNNYCNNSLNKCEFLAPAVLFDTDCDYIYINLFTVNGRNITETIKSEIIAEIAKNSTFSIHISFRNEPFKPCVFCIRSTPTTKVFINRREENHENSRIAR